LRICLKTKDDTHFWEEWLGHHRDIIGDAGLIVFDNVTEDPGVLDLCERISDSVLIVRFEGMMNNLHRPQFYPELYRALAQSSRCYTFIDTNEFLYWIEPGGDVVSGARVGDRIAACSDPVIPGFWFNNVRGYRDRFWISPKRNHFASGIRSGKPVVSSSVELRDMSNHNRHIPPECWMGCGTGNVVLAHLKNLYPDQRVKVNLMKLRAFNFMRGVFDIGDILSVDLSGLSPDHHILVREIQEFSGIEAFDADPSAPLPPGHVWMRGGKLVFGDSTVQQQFLDYIGSPQGVIAAVLGELA
jgi:hypothetical protein